VKTLPVVRLSDSSDAAALRELPEQICVALRYSGAAREGLLAMSVAAGLAVMQAMFEAENTAVAGPKGQGSGWSASLTK
jgi:putative transposase